MFCFRNVAVRPPGDAIQALPTQILLSRTSFPLQFNLPPSSFLQQSWELYNDPMGCCALAKQAHPDHV